jgi:hypothetical protein
MPLDTEIRVHSTAADTADGEAGAGHPASEGDEAAPRRVFPDSAEPLTAWRVDIGVLVGVAHHSVSLTP